MGCYFKLDILTMITPEDSRPSWLSKGFADTMVVMSVVSTFACPLKLFDFNYRMPPLISSLI